MIPFDDRMKPGERWEFVPKEDGFEVDLGGIRILSENCAGPWACWFGNDTTYYPSEGDPPTEERGKLMAAAPELRDSLRALLTFIEGPAESLPYWEKQEVLAEIEAARDLLAALSD